MGEHPPRQIVRPALLNAEAAGERAPLIGRIRPHRRILERDRQPLVCARQPPVQQARRHGDGAPVKAGVAVGLRLPVDQRRDRARRQPRGARLAERVPGEAQPGRARPGCARSPRRSGSTDSFRASRSSARAVRCSSARSSEGSTAAAARSRPRRRAWSSRRSRSSVRSSTGAAQPPPQIASERTEDRPPVARRRESRSSSESPL